MIHRLLKMMLFSLLLTAVFNTQFWSINVSTIQTLTIVALLPYQDDLHLKRDSGEHHSFIDVINKLSIRVAAVLIFIN